ATGVGADCTKTSPCATLAAGLATNRPIVKLSGLVKDNQTTTIDGKAVTILADPGAKLDRDGDGVILEVRGADADVTIVDLEITGQTGVFGSAISLVAGGTSKLALIRATVTGNQG